MTDRLKRLREPLATLVLGVVAINIVAALVRVGLHTVDEGIANAMRREGGQFMGLVSVLFVLLAVGACALLQPTTKHARLVSTLGFGLATTGTVLAGVFLGVGMFARQAAFAGFLEAVGGITDVALKAGACYLLWQLVRRSPKSVVAPPEVAAAPSAELEPGQTQPVVARDQAAGARWRTAGEAARGGEATWGDGSGGWSTSTPRPAPADGLPGRAPSVAATGEGAPAPRVQTPAPVSDDALHGPAAKADPSLWRS